MIANILGRAIHPGIILFVLATSIAHAAHPVISPTDMAQLPPYCKPRLGALIGGWGFDKAENDTWAAAIGEDYLNIHHYCWSLYSLMQYNRRLSDPKRGSYLSSAINDVDYVISKARPGVSKVLPEMLVHKGKVLGLIGRYEEAVQNINHALQIKVDYDKAYLQLADIWVRRQQKANALEALEAGLEHAPGSKSLRRRYKDLGGTNPLPEIPISSPTAEKKDAGLAARSDSEEAAVSPTTLREPSAPEAQDAAPSHTRIGSPTNPWCRFCTDEDEGDQKTPPR